MITEPLQHYATKMCIKIQNCMSKRPFHFMEVSTNNLLNVTVGFSQF